jgi:hypothetical protein
VYSNLPGDTPLPNDVPTVVTFSPQGFIPVAGGLEVGNNDQLPVLVLCVLARGEQQFRWCLTQEALLALDQVIDAYLKYLEDRYSAPPD